MRLRNGPECTLRPVQYPPKTSFHDSKKDCQPSSQYTVVINILDYALNEMSLRKVVKVDCFPIKGA